LALFGRKSRSEKMEEVVAEAVKAGLANSPMASSGYNRATPAEPTQMTAGQGILTALGQANPMDRPGVTPNGGGFGAMLGPAAPLLPAPIDTVLDESGRALPRKWEYRVAQNLDLTQTEVPFQILKSLTEQCDIIHRAIEIRVGDIAKQGWSFGLSDSCINEIMQDQNCSHAKASKIGREKYGDEINRLTAFWKNPYVASDRSWNEWITESLWQVFAFDQWCIYPRYSLGKQLLGLDVIDAPTIKILLDNRGDIPHPPQPAYQQVLWGFPRGEFTASPDADGSFYNGSGRNDEFITDQMSVYVKNRRTWSPYGFSPVEEAIPAATLYLDRQAWMRSEYQAGTMPMTFMKTNSMELTIERLAGYERILNERLVGSNAERHRIKVLPDGFDPVAMPTQDERFKPDLDEYIIKRVAAIFGVSPSALGVIARSGLGGGKGQMEGEQQSSETVSTRPMENYITDCINSLSRRYLNADHNVTFVLQDKTSAMDEMNQAKALQVSLFSGQKTLNDVQGELGQSLYDMPEADEPFIVAGNAIQFLKGMLNVSTTGETIGQSDQSAQGQSQSTQGDQPQASVSQGQAPQTDLKAQEAKAFAKFAAKPRARDFDFAHHTPEEIEVLKAQISDTPKGSVTKRSADDLPDAATRRKLEAKHAAELATALATGITGYREAIEQAIATTPPGTDFTAVQAIVGQAVQHNVTASPDALASSLRSVWEASITAGQQYAEGQMQGPFKPFRTGEKLTDLLSSADKSAGAIQGTTMQRMQTIIANGVHSQQSSKQIADQIASLLNDSSRADIIAVTETNRAYNRASLDTYQDNGATGWDWLAYDDACDICQAGEAENPHLDFSEPCPPEEDASHPNCRCSTAAYRPSTDNGE